MCLAARHGRNLSKLSPGLMSSRPSRLYSTGPTPVGLTKHTQIREFWNKHVRKLLREEGIVKYYSSHDQDTKASLAERLNHTIKEQVTHFMMYYNTNKWIDDLQPIVFSYNNTCHSSLGTSP